MAFDMAAQIETWRASLLDLSRRNRLIQFRPERNGVPLVHPRPDVIWQRLMIDGLPLAFAWKVGLVDSDEDENDDWSWHEAGALLLDDFLGQDWRTTLDPMEQCRQSPHLKPSDVLSDLEDKALASRLQRLAWTSRESLSEQGVVTLYVAFGALHWMDANQEALRSPLLLVPVQLERDSIDAPWHIVPQDEEIHSNHSLAELLLRDYKLRLPGLEDRGDLDDPAWRASYLEAVRQVINNYPDWRVDNEVALGVFHFQKLAMWEDLGRNVDQIGQHDVCRAIAGDPTSLRPPPPDLPRADELDEKTRPETTFQILDADSSQHVAITAATAGAHLVLDGPPGTGKSQTIANIIAEFLAAGKTVLFVSEKAAALEVVKRRLDVRGLGDFCLECHSHKANKRDVITELGRCLELPAEKHADPGDVLHRLLEARGQLNAYVRELHVVRSPLGKTAFEVQGELAELSKLQSMSRIAIPDILNRTSEDLRRLTELLGRLPECQTVLEHPGGHPWTGCRARIYSLTLRDDVIFHFGRVADAFDRMRQASARLVSVGFLDTDCTRPRWHAVVQASRLLLQGPVFPAAWFTGDPRATAQGYVELDEATKTYRQVRPRLAEFVPDLLQRMPGGSLGEWNSTLSAQVQETLRTRLNRLRALGPRLQELQKSIPPAKQATTNLLKLLPVKLSQTDWASPQALAKDIENLIPLLPLRKSWKNASYRKELHAEFSRALEEAQEAQKIRAERNSRLSSLAFGSKNRSVLAESARYESFFARLWPSWWRFKREITPWYHGGLPATEEILADMAFLRRYQHHIEFGQALREQYARDVVLDQDDEPDWVASLKALEAFEKLDSQATNQTELYELLSTKKKAEHETLGERAETLDKSMATLHGAMGLVNHDIPFGVSGTITFDVISEWATKQIASVTAEQSLLQPVVAWLAEGSDIPLDVLPAKLKALAQIGEIKLQLERLHRQLSLGETPIEERDWSPERELATYLLYFLDLWNGPLPASVIEALAKREPRASLEDAVRHNEQAPGPGYDDSWEFFSKLFDPTQPTANGVVLDEQPLAKFASWLRERTQDAQRLYEWVQYLEIAEAMQNAGVGGLLDEVRTRQVRLDEAAQAFRARFLRLWLDALHEQVPALRQFRTDAHEKQRTNFRALDHAVLDATPGRIRDHLLSAPDRPRPRGGAAPESSELFILQREVHKKRRHLPLRRLFAAIPTLLPRLKPCLMMSPLAVSAYLESPETCFDLVIFDEASQVRPHDAICAIYRGKQLLVAGDQKQLPPTSFFERGFDELEEDEEATALSDYESVLDVCCTLGLLRRRLRWHYRSRREPLIAFANQHFYNNELVTFPSVEDLEDNPAVSFHYLPQGRWKVGFSGGYNAVEARLVAEAIIRHFQQHPDKSLGVIAFSQRHQLRILDELEDLRRVHPGLEDCFAEDEEEPLFVKNLENVQGDERDVIFLSVGYGPDPQGKIAMRFGPLNQEGGARRLNVAITRARERMAVFSSLRAHDLDLSRTNAEGVQRLRAYLDYAERGPIALHGSLPQASQGATVSAFEQAVYEELTSQGFTLHRQVGCSGYRIDLAVVDPQMPGRYLLGIECDGSSYQSAATARDRDRLRQEVLESLGWSLCRIWSTDWVRDRQGQVQRVLSALEKARRKQPATPHTIAKMQPVLARVAVEVEPTEPVHHDYRSIDQVPERVLLRIVLDLLRQCGATRAEDLVKTVARQLGFKQTGRRIKARVEEAIALLQATDQIGASADGRLQATEQRIAE